MAFVNPTLTALVSLNRRMRDARCEAQLAKIRTTEETLSVDYVQVRLSFEKLNLAASEKPYYKYITTTTLMLIKENCRMFFKQQEFINRVQDKILPDPNSSVTTGAIVKNVVENNFTITLVSVKVFKIFVPVTCVSNIITDNFILTKVFNIHICIDFSCAAQQLNASQSTHRFSFVNHTIKYAKILINEIYIDCPEVEINILENHNIGHFEQKNSYENARFALKDLSFGRTLSFLRCVLEYSVQSRHNICKFCAKIKRLDAMLTYPTSSG
ncbi:hypothetical protein ANN_02898 [Periplaneta americana]|uniref:Uncharacterized protein n=1 Tax=Periplaneta americana TaxID=6978 RepID=A0ABQ8TXJ2_PERAM|nr:hypothetical protein ANN_02898 [Periplaneta americana]